MPLKEWNGSSWQVVAQLKVWNGSSWVALNDIDNAKTAKVWNGSSWVQFHPGVQLVSATSFPGTLSLYHDDTQSYPATATSSVNIILNSSGSAQYISVGPQNFSWLLTGANSDYYAWMDTPVGDSFTFGTVATSLQLNTTRQWELVAFQSGVGLDSKYLTSTLRIKNSSGTDIVAIDVVLQVQAEVF